MKKVIINGIEYSYNIDLLIKNLKYFEFEEESNGDRYAKYWIIQTKKEFDKIKLDFINKLTNLDNSIEGLIKRNVQLTSKGLLHKSKRYILIESGIVTGYTSEHGSHSYDEVCLNLSTNGNKSKLIISELGFQSSF